MGIRYGWLLGIGLMLGSAQGAWAGQITEWSFQKNRLDIKMDEGTQPKVMVLQSPTRLVIDLPYITGTKSEVRQSEKESVSRIRVSQRKSKTTRMVVELAPNYTWRSEKIKLKGVTPHHWQVKLPKVIPLSQIPKAELTTQRLTVPPPQLPKPKLK